LISSGETIEGLEIRIYDEDRSEVEEGVVGEIGISGGYLFEGYFGLDNLSKNVLLDGVYFTNDLGFIYSGQVFVLGRGDDVIIVQGRNLYAHQIEAILSEINGIKPGRNVAFGVSEEGLGSDFLVVICEKNRDIRRDERQIKREIRLRLESEIGVVPRTIKIENRGWLVKTSSGKISRKENKRKYLNA
jgi:acyl-CoA synthetase (AMP-forming)/AMP-acid ligase II